MKYRILYNPQESFTPYQSQVRRWWGWDVVTFRDTRTKAENDITEHATAESRKNKWTEIWRGSRL